MFSVQCVFLFLESKIWDKVVLDLYVLYSIIVYTSSGNIFMCTPLALMSSPLSSLPSLMVSL